MASESNETIPEQQQPPEQEEQQPVPLEPWPRLNITKGRASYAQERIWLDETFRQSILQNDQKLHNYNSLLAYKIARGSISIRRLQGAIKAVINKHEIFRTSLEYDLELQGLKQTINSSRKENYSYDFTQMNIEDSEKIDELLFNEETSNKYFDFNEGRLFRCHLIKQKKSKNNDENVLNENDFILFIFHHAAIDEYSRYLFLRELTSAYGTGKLNIDSQALRYIDYSQYERKMNLTEMQEFWENLFDNYNFEAQFRLPYDRKSSEIGPGASIPFHIDPSMTRQIFRYKQKMNISMFRLFLSCYYVFLYKLTQDEDFCVCNITPNRYRPELNHLIGPLENLLPYRFQVNPRETFNETVRKVEQLCQNIKQNGRYPFQDIVHFYRKVLARSPYPSFSAPSMKIPFMQTLLRVDIDEDEWHFEDDNAVVLTKLLPPTEGNYKRETNITPIDLTLKVKYNLNNKTIDFCFDYAMNRFDDTTIELIAERFQKILKHLFDVSSNYDKDLQPVYELSIILPREERIMDKIKNPYEQD